MENKQPGFSRFWSELKRRKTDKVIVVYAATAFTILQLEPILESALSLPQWTSTILIIILATGFPVAAIFSWFFDITPGGIQMTKPLKASERQKIESELKRWRWITMVCIFVIILLILFNVIKSWIENSEIKNSQKSIAVLTFKNLSPKEELPFNSDVITSIITSGLQQTNLFDVCPRFSVALLESSGKTLSIPEIAKKLEVLFVVNGEIVANKEKTVVNINLINKKNRSIWAHRYDIDRHDNIDTLNDIAIRIAKSLKLSLSPKAKSRIRTKPTKVPLAYLNYLRGASIQDLVIDAAGYVSKGDSSFYDFCSPSSYHKAISFYDKAIRADSTFALAYAKRAITRAWGFNAEEFTASAQMDSCKRDIENALRFDKGLIEAKVALGFYHYYFSRDYDKALEYFREVTLANPKYWQCKFYMGLVLRARGEWPESQKLMSEVVKSNPLNALFMTNIGLSYYSLHNYDTAIYYHNRAIKLMPVWPSAYQNKFEAILARDGITREAEEVIDSGFAMTKSGDFYKDGILIDLWREKFNDALAKATAADLSVFSSPGERYMMFAEIYRYLKSKELSKNFYKSAAEYFGRKLKEVPERHEILSYLGIASAGLDDRIKAVELGQQAIELSTGNEMKRTDRILDLAKIYALIGEYDKSIDLLALLLKSPSSISIKTLHLDPIWKPLHNMVKFRNLVSLYSV